MPYTSSNTTNPAPHSNNAALPSQSPYQQRTTQRDNPTQQLIRQAVDYLMQQLEAGHSETLAAYLGAMARFHSYSFGNILAIARQRPTATHVAGFYAWKELGRFVKKGEKGKRQGELAAGGEPTGGLFQLQTGCAHERPPFASASPGFLLLRIDSLSISMR